MIVGMGMDVASIARIARLITDHAAALGRLFTTRERRFCDATDLRRRAARYAAAFAAKEAVLKALGTGWRADIEWSDIDTQAVERHGGVVLSGGASVAAERLGVVRVLVCASTTRESAVAVAVAEGDARA